MSYCFFIISYSVFSAAAGLSPYAVGAEIIGLAADGLLTGGHGPLVMTAFCLGPEVIRAAADGPEAGLLSAIRTEIIPESVKFSFKI